MKHEAAILLAEHYVRLHMGARALEVLAEHALPDEARTWLWRANAHHELAQFDEAIGCAMQGLELAPEMSFLHVAIARAHLAAGRAAEAESPAREALRLAAHDAEAHSLLALILAATGRRGSAAKSSRYARELAPGAESVGLVEAFLAMQRGDKWEAHKLTGELLKAAPDSAAIHWLRGKSFSVRGEYRAAARHYRTAAELDPGNRTFAAAARVSNHWLLWPFVMSAPLGCALAGPLFILFANIWHDTGETRPVFYLLAWVFYQAAAGIAFLGLADEIAMKTKGKGKR